MKIIKRETLKQKPSPDAELGFGHYFTDYMFTMKYTAGEGWHDPVIEPNEPQGSTSAPPFSTTRRAFSRA